MRLKYIAVYKCRICNAWIQAGYPFEANYNDLPSLLGKVIQNQMFAGNPVLHQAPMYVPHQCKDTDAGSAGLAEFCGFMKK